MNEYQDIRLGFHYHVPTLEQGERYYVPGYFGRFLNALGERCSRLVCFLHSADLAEKDQMDYWLNNPSIEVVPIGPLATVPHRMLYARQYCQSLEARLQDLDALLLRGPSPLLPAMGQIAGSKPLILLLVGDYRAGVNDLPQPFWRKQVIRLWADWNRREQDRLARRSLTFVNSRKLYAEYQPIAARLVENHTTTLSHLDFYDRPDTCLMQPYHLLYSGRIDRTKGVLIMVEALSILNDAGHDLILDLVGWPEKGDPAILDDIGALAQAKGIGERVIYHGYHALGYDLFEFYRRADLFLLASTSSFEGFPRAIWEAMAHSLPVVATRVGSIPAFIEGAAELVEPRQTQALVIGIQRLLASSQLRQRYIQQGQILARQNTLEDQISNMLFEIKAWLR